LAVQSKIEELSQTSIEVDKKAGMQTLISLYLKQFEISVTFTQSADFELSEKLTLELIEDTKKYFEGNEIAENYVDPYMILASVYMQTNQIGKAMEYLVKAEAIIKALNGELNEKMLEIFTIQIQINMMK